MITARAEWTDGRDSRVERRTLGEEQLSTLQALASSREGPNYRARYITHERIAARDARARVESQTAARWLKSSERNAEGRTREGTHHRK